MKPLGRPYVILRSAMSLDGCIDDGGEQRLILSNEADFDRADEVRASCDAIIVGAGAVRADNPRLLIRSEQRRQQRTERGLSEHPIKVTWTRHGDLDPGCNFFQLGPSLKIVYCPLDVSEQLKTKLDGLAEVAVLSSDRPEEILTDLAIRGVHRVLVEGGTHTSTAFLLADLIDELHVSIAPFFVGDPHAPRLCGPGPFPINPTSPLYFMEVTQLGDVVELRYLRQRSDDRHI